MLRPPLIFRRITSTSRGRPCFYRPFSIASIRRSDALQSVLEGVYSPLEVTSVLRTGQGFKLRTLAQSTPFTVHGNLMLIDGEYFLWRPKLQFPQPGVLDIAPESWGLLDVIAPKPGTSENLEIDYRNSRSWDWRSDIVCQKCKGDFIENRCTA